MGTMCIQSKTLSLALKGCKWECLIFQRNRLEPRVVPWQQNGRCHSVSFVMYITGAKFEDHCFNILGDILDSVFYYLFGTIYDIITFLICIIQKREYLLKRQKLVQKGKRHSSWLWKSFQKSSNYVYFIGTLKLELQSI